MHNVFFVNTYYYFYFFFRCKKVKAIYAAKNAMAC